MKAFSDQSHQIIDVITVLHIINPLYFADKSKAVNAVGRQRAGHESDLRSRSLPTDGLANDSPVNCLCVSLVLSLPMSWASIVFGPDWRAMSASMAFSVSLYILSILCSDH